MRKSLIIIASCLAIITAGCIEEVTMSQGANGAATDVNKLKPLAVSIVDRALASDNGIIKSHAIEVVSTTGVKEFVPAVMRHLQDDSIAVRFAAAMAIGDMKYEPGKFAVERLMNDDNANAKIAAAYALTRLGEAGHRKTIIDAVKSKDQTVRANAALLIGKLKDRSSLEMLYWVVNDADTGDMARMQAAESIAMLGDKNIYEKIWGNYLISKYVDDKIIGIRAMGALNTIEARNSIISMLDDETAAVRMAAAEQLGQMGDRTGAIEVLEYLTKSGFSVSKTRISAADSLASTAIGRIGGDELTRYLPEMLRSNSEQIRLNAAQSVLLLAN